MAEDQAHVAGARLGLRAARGHDHELHRVGRVGGPGGVDGLGVLLLHQEQDLELLLGVVELAQVAHQAADDVGLPEHRHQHRVDRAARRRGSAPPAAGPTAPHRAPAGQGGDQLEARRRRGSRCWRREQRTMAVRSGSRTKPARRPGEGAQQRDALAQREGVARGGERVALVELVGGVVGEALGEDAAQHRVDVPLGGGEELDLDRRAQLRRERGRQTRGSGGSAVATHTTRRASRPAPSPRAPSAWGRSGAPAASSTSASSRSQKSMPQISPSTRCRSWRRTRPIDSSTRPSRSPLVRCSARARSRSSGLISPWRSRASPRRSPTWERSDRAVAGPAWRTTPPPPPRSRRPPDPRRRGVRATVSGRWRVSHRRSA